MDKDKALARTRINYNGYAIKNEINVPHSRSQVARSADAAVLIRYQGEFAPKAPRECRQRTARKMDIMFLIAAHSSNAFGSGE